MSRLKAELVKMVSRLAINGIIEILQDESALSLWHANVFRESLLWQHICLAALQPLINGKLHLTSSKDTHFFSSASFRNGKVYKCSTINEASSALKMTANVDLNVCTTLSLSSCWRTTPSNSRLCSDGALMVGLNPRSGQLSTVQYQQMTFGWKHCLKTGMVNVFYRVKLKGQFMTC